MGKSTGQVSLETRVQPPKPMYYNVDVAASIWNPRTLKARWGKHRRFTGSMWTSYLG